MVLGNKCSQTADAALTQQTPATNAASTQQNSATNARSGTHLTQMWHTLTGATGANTAITSLYLKQRFIRWDINPDTFAKTKEAIRNHTDASEDDWKIYQGMDAI